MKRNHGVTGNPKGRPRSMTEPALPCHIGVGLSEEMFDQLNTLTRRRGVHTRNTIVREAIALYLKGAQNG